MATIVARKKNDGTMSYTAQIRIKEGGKVIHAESKTFSKRSVAKSWAAAREQTIRANPQEARRNEHAELTIRELIHKYIDSRERLEPLGRTKREHLDLISRFDLADMPAMSVTTQNLIDHVMWRREQGTGPSTVHNDLVWLRVVYRYARSALGIPLDPNVIDDTNVYCRAERITARSNRRRRRPTYEELAMLTEKFRELRKRSRRNPGPPLDLLMWAAIYSARRAGELCRMRLSDLDRKEHTWVIQDVKHPEGSKGHHMTMVVTDRFLQVVDEALRVIEREPGDDRLFPYNSRTITSAWTKRMRMFGIEDLHFHDLRHEACSRLAEDGYTIPQIQQISLHESWGSLQVYVNVNPRKGPRCEFVPEASSDSNVVPILSGGGS